MTNPCGPDEAMRISREMWGQHNFANTLNVSTSNFQCKIYGFEEPCHPKITYYPFKIVGYVLEKLGIAIKIPVIRKSKNEVIYINTKDLINWRHNFQIESYKGSYIDQIKSVDAILTGEGRPRAVPL